MEQTLENLRETVQIELEHLADKHSLTGNELCNAKNALHVLKLIKEMGEGDNSSYRRSRRSMRSHLEKMKSEAQGDEDKRMIDGWIKQTEGR